MNYMEEFKVYVVGEDRAQIESLIRRNRYIVIKHEENDENLSKLRFVNKYFTCSVNVQYLLYTDIIDLQSPYAFVFVDHQNVKNWFEDNKNKLEDSECIILISDGYNSEVEDWALDNVIEYVHDKFDVFEGFRKEDGENVGIARLREAIECAAAPFSKSDPVGAKKTDEHVPTQEEIEHDLDTFEYFLNKIKEAREMTGNCTDEERKQRAESTIKELMEKFNFEDD